jgi:ABC-2 type transport system permease protein
MTGAFGACAYLVACTIRNRMVAQLRRLKSPRYLLPVAVACAYFFLIFYQPGRDPVEFPVMFPGARRNVAGEVELFSACGLALISAKWWLFGSPHAALAFTGPEVQFLFPAPIRRWMLVLYKIGRAQLSLILSAIIITVLAKRAGAHLAAPLRVFALWILLCTLLLHQMGATLVRTGAAQRGRGLRRNAIPLIVAGGALLVLMVTAFRAWPGARGVGDVPAAITRVWTALRAPLPYAILWPFRLAAAPAYAETAHAWLLAIWPALIILALHVLWVLRADAIFEDAAVEASAVRAEHQAQARARATGLALPTPSVVSKVSGSMAAVRLEHPTSPFADKRRTFMPLASSGDPRVALLWKNTLALVRGLRIRTLVLVSVSLSAVVLSFRELGLFGDPAPAGGAVLFGALALTAAAFLIILGPLAIRNDLRQDLLHIDMLRTYPLDGASLVFAEVMSSTLALTVVQWVLVTGGYLLLAIAPATLAGDPSAIFETHFADRTTTLVVGVAVLPVINAASFVVQNGAALLFPGWVRLGGSSMGGLELIGQRILGVAASFTGMALLLALPVAAMIIALAPWNGVPTSTPFPFFGAVIAGVSVAMGEIYLAIQWLGTRFERTDASQIIPLT